MKHHCRYCGEKLMEDEDRVNGVCDRCNYEFATVEDDGGFGCVQCSICGEYLDYFDYNHSCNPDWEFSYDDEDQGW